VVHFPDVGVPPYSFQFPRAALRAARIETLARLLASREGEEPWVVLTTPEALFQRIPHPRHFRRFVRRVAVGDRLEMETLLELLARLGYQVQTLVGEYGDFSHRGGIVDVYSFGRENPVRIEFDDDEIVSLREFDVYTQRSLGVLSATSILPLWEAVVGEEDWTAAEASGFMPTGGPLREHLDLLRSEGSFEGLEWMLAGLEVPLGTLVDFTGQRAIAVAEDPVLCDQHLEEARKAVLTAAPERNPEDSQADPEDDAEALATLFSSPEELYVMQGGIQALLAECPTVYVGVGAREHVRHEEGAVERKPKGSGWTADDQLCVPDPLDVGPQTAKQSPEWRAMLARRIREESKRKGSKEGATDEAEGGTLPTGEAWEPTGGAVPAAVEADLLEAELSWSDQHETSALLAYTSHHFTLHTRPQEHFGRNLDLARDYIRRLRQRGLSVTILCDTAPHRERLEELMEGLGAGFVVGNLAGGFELPALNLAVLTDHEIFQRIRRRRAGRRFSRGLSVKELLAMRPGDFVVHIDHGIGVYRGIERLTVNGHLTDCMRIEYAGGDKLFIPVDQLDLVQKYAAEEAHRPRLNKLGTNQWAKTKARVKKSIRDIADELIKLYALRKARPGHAFSPDTVWQSEMEARFPYDETPDQIRAIQEVKGDMERGVPMDRLICGDVGFGKTEVAIRAAFKAVLEGKQVAFLVPTTLLAQQHYDTVRDRLRGYPVRVEMLSRFRTRKEVLAVLKDLAAGKVDIAVGTHRLLSKDVKFKHLGLVIVDEEQRFGVTHKERLKKMRTQVDVLTLTATPIPRTMNLALMGARDMTTIRTPPRDRRPIQTEIVEFGEEVITYALMREADRGGQSFFVHNRVESIDAMANYVRALVPHLRVAVAHGQMRERQLEDVMRKFLAREYDVLLSTMIIESGLDLPNVNTIVVNRTDTFGLAQLYQLRGRVGRSARKAYAYLLVPPDRVMTEVAMKRLKAIEEFEDLGSGFQLAMRDLEIRGAGNILGSEQHGFIINVGFDLYMRLMVTDLKAYLPREYIPDDPEKMNVYKRLADATDVEAIDELASEVNDRFGRLPDAAENLFELRRLRVRASRAGIETMSLREGGVVYEMSRELTREDVQRLIRQMPIPVTFKTHGNHRVEALRSDVCGQLLLVAGQILECLMED
jgi:transcription-repair coupling factor